MLADAYEPLNRARWAGEQADAKDCWYGKMVNPCATKTRNFFALDIAFTKIGIKHLVLTKSQISLGQGQRVTFRLCFELSLKMTARVKYIFEMAPAKIR